MYHQEPQQNHRSRSRCGEKPQNAGLGVVRKPISGSDLSPICSDLTLIGRARGEGNVQLRNRAYARKIALDSSGGDGLPIEEDSFALGSRRSSSKKASGTPTKALIGEEISRQTEIRRPSPGVIGKLMGLETMPLHVVSKQQKEIGNFRKASNAGFKEKYVTCEDRSLWTNTNEHQEIKDVFEVVQTLKFDKHKNQKVQKGTPSLKQSEIDMAFIKQEFTDEEHLPTDETLQNSKRYNDALDVLDSSNDLIMKFLQAPNSLFTKHLHDLKCDPSSRHASHITILKSSKGTTREISEVRCTSRRNVERFTHMQRADVNSYKKPATSYACQSLREHSCYLPNKLSQSLNEGKTQASEAYHHSPKIVVLKPSLEKAQNMVRTIPSERSYENFQFRCKGHRELPRSGIQDLHSECRDCWLSDNEEVMKHKIKSSREIAREFTEQVRNTISSGTQKILPSKFNGYSMDESSSFRSGMGNLNKPDAFRWTPTHFDDCRSSFGVSSSNSIESSVNREARKRLSKRWKMIQRFQEVGLDGRRSSTLGEMLALSDTKTPTTTKDPLLIQEVPNKEVAGDEALATRGTPFGISSKDGWKNSCSTNLTRSIPASSTLHSNPKPSSRNRLGGADNYSMLGDIHNMGPNDYSDRKVSRQGSSSLRRFKHCSNKPQFYYDGEEDKLPEKEIHVNSEKLRERVHVGYHAKEKYMVTELPEDAIAPRRDMVDSVLISECNDEKFPSITNEKLVKQPTTLTVLAKHEPFSGYNQKDILIKETSIEHLQADRLPPHCNISGSGSPVSSDEADRPSPVSILEPPSKEEKSGCFEKITADLQELRIQLQLFKFESADKYAEELEVLDSSDDETGGDHRFELLQEFRDEEERDFSYLLDVVIESGVHSSDSDVLFDACYSRDDPVGAEVFDRLEKKYSLLLSWSRSERKLLFDLINATLLDIVVPYMDMRQRAKPKRRFGPRGHEGFVEEVWQMVVRRRNELSSDLGDKLLGERWLDLGNDVDMIGREIERMINDEILEELVSELFGM